jgi:SNF2 family DNA or RNA helicase
MLDYEYKTEPYKHQDKVFKLSRDLEDFAFLMGMGTGKSKVGLDSAAWLWARGKVNLLVIIAPNGVHRNWILREIPAHMPVWTKFQAAVWASPSVIKADERRKLDKLSGVHPGLKIVAMNVEAFGQGMQGGAAKYLAKMINGHRTMICIDESSKIKTPGVKRTTTLTTLGKRADYRRIMTGTLITNGPLDAFAQLGFLGAQHLGFDNFYSYKHYFAEWERKKSKNRNKQGKLIEYEDLVCYRNLNELTEKINAVSYRVTKEECLDLPDKVYERRTVLLSQEQTKLYKDISKKSMYELAHGEMTVANVLSKLLRLQQVLGGFVPAEEYKPAVAIPGPNNRIQALLDVVEQSVPDGKIIIWARFRAEHAAIAEALRKEYGRKSVVEYHGGVDNHTREINVDRFQEDDTCQFFIGQPHSGGYGLTLTAAKTVIYYSNDFSLEARLQSEDRAHRIGQTAKVTYVDLEAEKTIDTKIITALRGKKNISDVILQDKPATWL